MATESKSDKITDTTTRQDNATDENRKKLLSIIDSMVKMHNEADFESLMGILSVSCSKNVVVITCLEAPSSTNKLKVPSVSIGDNHAAPYITQEKSVRSVALIWMLLHTAHPDGIMKIIDKRICYRALSPVAPADHGSVTNFGETLPTAVAVPSASLAEMVVTLCGSCIVQRPLHEVLVQATLEQTDRRFGQSPLQSAVDIVDHRIFLPANAAVTAAPVSGPVQEIIVAKEAEALARLLATHVGQRAAGGADSVDGTRWRYLIEFRLQFDEHDLVTHWTTTMLAAEPEDVFG
jgi:hypothetical protein